MRVCKHRCGVKMFRFSRGYHTGTNFKKFWSSKIDKFTLFGHFFVGLQTRPLALHASKLRISGNTHLTLRYSSLPANVFRGSSCVPALRSSTVEATDVGPLILKRKHPDTTPSIHFFYSGCTTQRMFFTFVKVRIPGGTCVDSPFNGFFHF